MHQADFDRATQIKGQLNELYLALNNPEGLVVIPTKFNLFTESGTPETMVDRDTIEQCRQLVKTHLEKKVDALQHEFDSL